MRNAWQSDGNRAIGRFIDPTRNEQSEEWLQLDARLPADHLARRIDRVVQCLDLTALIESYAGVGRKAYPPDLMVKIVLYEIHSKKLSPAQWSRDVREHGWHEASSRRARGCTSFVTELRRMWTTGMRQLWPGPSMKKLRQYVVEHWMDHSWRRPHRDGSWPTNSV